MRAVIFQFFLVSAVALVLMVPLAQASEGGAWIAEFVWAPQFCRDNANERSSEVCNAAYGLVLHRVRPPSGSKCSGDLGDATLDSATRVIASPRWVKQMWRRDGRCSGKTGSSYFDFVSLLTNKIELPQALRIAPQQPTRISRSQVESKILSVNRDLSTDAVVLHCEGTFLAQIDLCFDDHQDATSCPAEVKKACGASIDLRDKK